MCDLMDSMGWACLPASAARGCLLLTPCSKAPEPGEGIPLLKPNPSCP